ncbi:MAG: hypothetical protein ACRD8W_25695 [Nitrososphaeraceae archaeon]
MQKIIFLPLAPAGIGLTVAILSLFYPIAFGLTNQAAGYNGIITTLLGLTGGSIFLSSNM